jgi:hypothetical protein
MHCTAGLATAAGNGKAAAAPQDAAAAAAQPTAGYKEPPKEILDIVDAPPQPGLTFSPDRTKVRGLANALPYACTHDADFRALMAMMALMKPQCTAMHYSSCEVA